MTTATANPTERCVISAEQTLTRYATETVRWPTFTDPDTGQVRLSLGGSVDALSMSAELGHQVNHHLVQALQLGPIIEVLARSSASWIYLTQQRTPLRSSTVTELLTAGACWYDVGSTILLPPAMSRAEYPRWIQRPHTGKGLPRWEAVVGAVRRAIRSAW
ncbi:hypothetical protein [Actinoalloteichus caeruleus]|uniref:hypothetical protein n=1 Tax=Actinoalloteichus cyanogriseus TaxID=2893586 RepID=UPI003BB8681F